jgi:hypothetical protein
MSRPKSSWAEIIGAIGALSAAEGAHRAADEVRNLQALQQSSLTLLQDHLEYERQRHEAEDRLRGSTRKFKQAVFDFSEALIGLKQDIEGLLPDYHCAAALFYEMDLQRHADAFYENRELLESYKDKKLIKNCLEAVGSIRASIEECALAQYVTLDQLAGALFARHSEIRQWQKLSSDTRNAVERLSRSIGEWEKGPDDFLNALERLREESVSARGALDSFAEKRRQFWETLEFVSNHPNVGQVWREAWEASPSTVEDVVSRGGAVLSQAEQLLGKWVAETTNFKALKDSFSEARYEDFQEKLDQCPPHVRQLKQVRSWAETAVARLRRASELIQSARGEIVRRNWRVARTILLEAEAIPCSRRLRIQLKELELIALDGMLPARLTWVVSIGALLAAVSYWLGILTWFLLAIGVTPLIVALMLLPQIIAARRSGGSWRAILNALIMFFLRMRITWS